MIPQPRHLLAPPAHLGLAAVLLLAAGRLPAQAAPQVSVPVVLEDRSGGCPDPMPVRFGVPFPEGALADPIDLELATPSMVVPATSHALARRPGGSVKWLAVDLIAPPQTAGVALAGTLRDRSSSDPLVGVLEVYPPLGGNPLTVDVGHFQLQHGLGAGELFHVIAPAGGMRSPMRAKLESLTQRFFLAAKNSGSMEIEYQDDLTVTVVRRDTYEAADGRDVFLLTTRATVWRGQPLLRLQQSLDVLAGLHHMQTWSVVLPMDAPSSEADLVFGNGKRHRMYGSGMVLQTDWDTLFIRGNEVVRSQPAVYAFDDLALGVRHFWQKSPTSLLRVGDDMLVSFCPGDGSRSVVMEEGFGSTRELWLWVGGDAPKDRAAAARVIDSPPVVRASPAWTAASGVFGALTAPRPGFDDDLEARVPESIDAVYSRWDLDPRRHYGIRQFGDFFDGEHSLAYSGPLQQEYDPGFVTLLQYLRSGAADRLERGLDLAWHAGDVDLSWTGGASQHRATIHHVDSWISAIFGQDYQTECHASGYYDGSLHSIWRWVGQNFGAPFYADLQAWVDIEVRYGAEGFELEQRLFRMIGQHLQAEIERDLVIGSLPTLYDYAAAMAADPRAQARGYSDPDLDFLDFFVAFGGSWADFPVFHVDNHPVPVIRHQGSHSLIQGVVLGHYLSGEPRLREVALRLGRHHVAQVVPTEVANLAEQRTTGSDPLRVRTVAWPLVNLVTLAEMTSGIPDEAAAHGDFLLSAQICAAELVQAPPVRIESSIHAGLALEALADFVRLTGEASARTALIDLGRYWALNHYDWNEHAFLQQAGIPGSASSGMTGLVIYGLAFGQTLQPDPQVDAVLKDAWDYLAGKSSYAKAFAMRYRGALRCQGWIR